MYFVKLTCETTEKNNTYKKNNIYKRKILHLFYIFYRDAFQN